MENKIKVLNYLQVLEVSELDLKVGMENQHHQIIKKNWSQIMK
jgi:hypothetical protein